MIRITIIGKSFNDHLHRYLIISTLLAAPCQVPILAVYCEVLGLIFSAEGIGPEDTEGQGMANSHFTQENPAVSKIGKLI